MQEAVIRNFEITAEALVRDAIENELPALEAEAKRLQDETSGANISIGA